MDTLWRFLDSGAGSASYNMALDEAIAISVRTREAPATLRFYSWDRPSLSLGCFQKTEDLDLDYCRQNSIPVVRRPTGGRAVLHGYELTYSFSVPTDRKPFSGGLIESYRMISRAFNLAFQNTGISVRSEMTRERGRVLARNPLCFGSSSYGELLLNNQKIAGAAQKRWKDGLLQQGALPYVCDTERICHITGRKTSEQDSVLKGLKEILPHFDEQNFREAVRAAFEETFSVRLMISHPEPKENLHALELQQQKYHQDSWNLRL